MNPRLNKTANAILLALGGLAILAVSFECLAPARPRPAALTRYAIEQCERAEPDILKGIAHHLLPSGLSTSYAQFMRHSMAFREGYVRVGGDSNTAILDGWGQPLHIVYKTNFLTGTDVATGLLLKTNAVLIWSSGPNGINERGKGDDIFLPD